MSYGPPQGGGGGYPPAQQGGNPNYQQNMYPQQNPPYGGQGGYPPQGGYGPPQGQYGPPQGQYGPPQGQWNQQGPPGGYGGPPQGQWNQQGPPGGYGGPPQGQYAPPQGQHGGPPQQQWNQQGPPGGPPGYPPQAQPPYGQQQGGYGAPPPGQYGGGGGGGGYGPPQGQPSLPSPGYNLQFQAASVDVTREVEALYKAMKGLGTNENALIQTLTRVHDPLVMGAIRQNYNQRFMKDLVHHIVKETSGHFEYTLCALTRGPLAQDVHALNDSLAGVGTNELLLNHVLIGRSNADLMVIKQEYQRLHHRTLESAVKADLSMKTERLFEMILTAQRAEESTPVFPQQVDQDATELHRATEGTKMGADSIQVCQILSSRSDGQIRAISQAYKQKYHMTLEQILRKEITGHMLHALLLMLHRAEDRVMADAVLLEESMAEGLGTKDKLLINVLVTAHWRPGHLSQVKRAYHQRYHRDLVSRVKGETSGHYEDSLVAILQAAG